MVAVPIAFQISCVRREIGMREHMYPQWVTAHKMTQKKSDEELAAMRAVLETLEGIEAAQRLI